MTQQIRTNNKNQKQTTIVKAALIIFTGLAASLIANPTFANDSAHHASKAGKHSALAVSHGAASTAKVASAVVAVPLIAAGSVMQGAGTLSANAGKSLMTNATGKNELTVTDITITADASPQEAMKTMVNTTKTTTQLKTQTTTTTKIQEQK